MTDETKYQGIQEFKKLVLDKNFEVARKNLLENKNIDPALRNYNLAFLEHKEGDLVMSRFYLEKAKSEGLHSKELYHALENVKSELEVVEIEDSYSSYEDFLMKSSIYSEDLFLGSIGLLLFLGLFCFWFSKKMIGGIFVSLMLGAGLFYFGQVAKTETSLAKNTVSIYKGPSRIFEELQVTSKGMRIVIDKVDGDWSRIKYPEHYRGWAYKLKVKSL